MFSGAKSHDQGDHGTNGSLESYDYQTSLLTKPAFHMPHGRWLTPKLNSLTFLHIEFLNVSVTGMISNFVNWINDFFYAKSEKT